MQQSTVTKQSTLKGIVYLFLIIFVIGSSIITFINKKPLKGLDQNNFSTYDRINRVLFDQKDISIQMFEYFLNITSQMANLLKIVFQLSALLFIITDLVNFWNLASIYIFLSIEIPNFCKRILINIFNQFNQPILSYLNISFDQIILNQSNANYSSQDSYKKYLDLDFPSIAFEPLVIIIITSIQLVIFSFMLAKIKKCFRQIRSNIKTIQQDQRIDVDKSNYIDVKSNFIDIDKQNQNPLTKLSKLLKSNKVQPLIKQAKSKSIAIKKIKHLIKVNSVLGNKQKKNQQQQIKIQQSQKHIIDEMPRKYEIVQQKQDQIINYKPDEIVNQKKDQITNYRQDQSKFSQLKLIQWIQRFAKYKHKTSQNKYKHWSQKFTINKFEIISALLLSILPTVLLPFYKSITFMQMNNFKSKINFFSYNLLISLLFIYPFIYLITNISKNKFKRKLIKTKNRKQKAQKLNLFRQQTKIVKDKQYTLNNCIGCHSAKQQNNCLNQNKINNIKQIQKNKVSSKKFLKFNLQKKPPNKKDLQKTCLQNNVLQTKVKKKRIRQIKVQKNKRKQINVQKNKNKQNKIKNLNKKKNKLKGGLKWQIKQQVMQNFILFFINMSIPISSSIHSSCIPFLGINLLIHILFLFWQILFYHKNSCLNKLQKISKITHKLTFLLYHLTYCLLHFYNQIKQQLVKGQYITLYTHDTVFNIFGLLIIGLFAIGGLHQMLEFIFYILFNFFKLVYMIFRVIVGAYDIDQLQQNTHQKISTTIQKQQNNAIKEQINKQPLQYKQPLNTKRDLDQLSVELQIEVIRNQVIIQKMKYKRLQFENQIQIIQL